MICNECQGTGLKDQNTICQVCKGFGVIEGVEPEAVVEAPVKIKKAKKK